MAYKPKLTVELYKVHKLNHHQPLEEVFEHILSESLQERRRLIHQTDMRLDAAKKPSEKEPYWLINFSKVLNVAPGQRGKNEEITDINLQDGHDFAEETALLYVPKSEYILLQYSHYGPRISAINEYLNSYIANSEMPKHYEFLIKLKPDAEARLDSKEIITEVELRVAPAQMSAAMRKKGKTLGTAIDTLGNLNAESIYIQVRSKKDGDGLSVNGIKNFFKDAAKVGVAKTARITGYDNEEGIGKPDMVDLIKDKEKHEFENVPLSKAKRWSASTRYDYLKKAYNGWKRQYHM